jgi:uncharacterized peroxidase-related enzyme
MSGKGQPIHNGIRNFIRSNYKMARLNPVNREIADRKTAQMLSGVEKKFGIVPNMIATMAQSNAVASAYLGFSAALSGGQLPAPVREQIALTVGQQNECDYCLAAHSAIGTSVGLDQATLIAARQGKASDAKTDAILKFASRLLATHGKVDDEDVNSLTNQGLSEGEIAEVIANVVLNIFTNYFNHVAETEIDFPEPAELPCQLACACGS